MNFVGLVLGLVPAIIVRGLAALGFSMLVLTGLSAGIGTLRQELDFALGSLPQAALELAGLYGVWSAVGIWLGAISFVLAWRTASGFWQVGKS